MAAYQMITKCLLLLQDIVYRLSMPKHNRPRNEEEIRRVKLMKDVISHLVCKKTIPKLCFKNRKFNTKIKHKHEQHFGETIL